MLHDVNVPGNGRMDIVPEISSAIATTPVQTARHPKLLDSMREALRARHYSRRTEETYCHWVKRFVHFHVLNREGKGCAVRRMHCSSNGENERGLGGSV